MKASKEAIKLAAIEAHRASEKARFLGMVNISNKSDKEREKEAVEYALARAEAYEAEAKLHKLVTSSAP